MGEAGSAVGGGRRPGVVLGVLVGLAMTALGCSATSGPVVGEDVPPVPTYDLPAASSLTEEADCEAVVTVLLLVGERIMAAAAEAPPAERAAVEDAYAEARRALPPNLVDAVAEVEQLYDRIAVEYLDLVAGLRDGAPYDRLEVLQVFESRRPELREIVERTGLDEPCERLGRLDG